MKKNNEVKQEELKEKLKEIIQEMAEAKDVALPQLISLENEIEKNFSKLEEITNKFGINFRCKFSPVGQICYGNGRKKWKLEELETELGKHFVPTEKYKLLCSLDPDLTDYLTDYEGNEGYNNDLSNEHWKYIGWLPSSVDC